MAKNNWSKKGSFSSKTLFVLGIATVFFIIAILGFILYLSYSTKEKRPEPISTSTVVAKIEKPQPPVPQKPHIPLAKVAIIIDDLGRDRAQLKEILEIDAPIAIAVLPFLPNSENAAKEAYLNGREVLLHLPMEPKDLSNNDPGEGAILTTMSEKQVASQVKKDIDAIPHIIGINNHMGSKFTENERLMKIVLEIAKEKNLFFLDSKTTNKSTAYRLAKELGLKTLSRQVFLDNKEDIDYIKGQIRELIEVAKKRGSAIAIGHPHHTTILAIKEMVPMLKREVEIVALSTLIDSVDE